MENCGTNDASPILIRSAVLFMNVTTGMYVGVANVCPENCYN